MNLFFTCYTKNIVFITLYLFSYENSEYLTVNYEKKALHLFSQKLKNYIVNDPSKVIRLHVEESTAMDPSKSCHK